MFRNLRPLGIAAGIFALSTVVGSCAADRPLSTLQLDPSQASITVPAVVISQIYGGGGNAGATLRNDFIELHNTSASAVSVAGWSVQYASAAGSTWQVTALTGSIPAGGYYLIQEAAGSGGTVSLPTPNASGTIAMSATAGKVALVNGTTAITGTCGVGSLVIDKVSYGSSTDCTFGMTAGLTNTTAAQRKDLGCAYTEVLSADFVVGTPAPRNLASPANICDTPPPPVVVHHVHVTPATATMTQGGPAVQFSAVAHNETHGQVIATFTWSSSATTIATVANTGSATSVNPGTANIIATAGGKSDFGVLTVEEAPIPGLPSVRFSEIHYDNFDADMGEAIEIEGPADTDLTGWSVVLYNGNGGASYDTRVLTQTIPDMCAGRGVVVLRYEQDGIQNGSPDGLALVNAGGTVVEFLSYEGPMVASNGPAAGMTSTNIVVSQSSAPLFQTLQRRPSGHWEGPKPSTLGGCYGSTPVTPFNQIRFEGRSPFGDPPIPVGFEAQIFADLIAPNGSEVSTTITWSPETPALASIDAQGVIRGIASGSAKFRATASDAAGTTATFTLPIHVATEGPAVYANHVEFGTPTDGDASDDYIISRREFTSSFNQNRGIPNWVSFNIEGTHFGEADRCNCFTYDPLLPFASYKTSDYTGAGAFHGYPIDRGHLARSADRTAGTMDNARTYYFSNIIPQAAANNQGPWARMENAIGALAEDQNKELFVIAGASGSKGSIKNEGKITIPTHTWKVVVVLSRDQGLGDVDSFDDVEVIAVIMPNDKDIPTQPGNPNDWKVFLTTVNAIEALSGYDLLSLLPKKVQAIVETGLQDEMALVDRLVADGKLNKGNGNALSSKLEAAAESIENGNAEAARNQLASFLNQLDALDNKKLGEADATALRNAINALIASL
jgi:DNA/RNA endonuclease G (NUC1)